MKEVTLIANSGLQFVTTTMTINPKKGLALKDSNGESTGDNLEYTFYEGKVDDDMKHKHLTFNLCIPATLNRETVYIPFLSEDVNMLNNSDDFLLKDGEGNWILNAAGLPINNPDEPVDMLADKADGCKVYSIDSLDTDGFFEKLLGKWLPMPMYEIGELNENGDVDGNGETSAFPHGWCRVRIDEIGEQEVDDDDHDGVAILKNYRLTWAFDTKLAKNDAYKLRPFFNGASKGKKYGLCNKTDLLIGPNRFISKPDGNVGQYLFKTVGINFNPTFDTPIKPKRNEDDDYYEEEEQQVPECYQFCKLLGFYIYLINYLRLTSDAVPEVILYNSNNPSTEIPVDMSIDIGNSRTCATLYAAVSNKDEDLFRNAAMLGLRDLSEPWNLYNEPFDTRFVFRNVSVGDGIHFYNIASDGEKECEEYEEKLFVWPSFVRVGEEAHRLICCGGKNDNVNDCKTYYSSPKRYLWDNVKFNSVWRNLVFKDDKEKKPTIFIEGLSNKFSRTGKYISEGAEDYKADEDCKYSRRSMTTFVLMEILQQAFCFINSDEFRGRFVNNKQFRHCLRNIIVTCPTAMPIEEQIALRRAAEEAKRVLTDFYYPQTPKGDKRVIDRTKIKNVPTIIPKYRPYEEGGDPKKRTWQYDEALANQFVYLYAELQDKYQGNVSDFLRLRGHVREELSEKGFKGNALTIGSIDIGAGTTDVMVAAYGLKGEASLTPVPLYYDTFYQAGDDIMHKLIKEVIIEDLGDNNDADKAVYDEQYGSIGHSVKIRIGKMSDEELFALYAVKQDDELAGIVKMIANKRRLLTNSGSTLHTTLESEIKEKIDFLAGELLKRFFGNDISSVYIKERNFRVDFCNQVSIPLAQFFLDLLRENVSSQDFTYDQIFKEYKPDQDLLTYFKDCFGFSFKSLKWHYDKDRIAEKVRSEMDDLIKKISMVLYKRHCDILILSGRPTGLKPLTDLLMKYLPVAPHRMVTLEGYNFGDWYPFSFAQGKLKKSQKALVSVGAEIGYLASEGGFGGLNLDFSELKSLNSTVKYIGFIKDNRVENPFFEPTNGKAKTRQENVHGKSVLIGCKQYNVPKYIARPLFVVENKARGSINLELQRDYDHTPEKLETTKAELAQSRENVTDRVTIRVKTMIEDDFWMDNGVFLLR